MAQEQKGAAIDKQAINREAAIEFLAGVVKTHRPKGTFRTQYGQHCCLPIRYSKNPAREFLDGWKQTFESKGHPKAKGANFSVRIPPLGSQSKRSVPTFCKTLRVKGGHGHELEMVAIVTKSLPVPLGTVVTQQDQLLDMFSPAELRGSRYRECNFP